MTSPRLPSVPGVVVPRVAALALVLSILIPAPASGQVGVVHEESYLTPPGEVAALVTAPREAVVRLSNPSPDGRYFLRTVPAGLPSLADFARPYLRLAGLELDPGANRHRNLTARGDVGLELISARDGSVRTVTLPAGTTVSSPVWSSDGSRAAVVVNRPEASHLYVLEVESGELRRLTDTPLLATRVTEPAWSGDGRHLFAVFLPEDRAAPPAAPAVPPTPLIRVTSPEENRLRTYPSLLRDPHDGELLAYYTTGQLARIGVVAGGGEASMEPVGAPAMIEALEPAPEGGFLRVRTTERPFSYIVPVSLFADADEVWDLEGTPLAELERRPVRKGVQDAQEERERDRKRSIAWRPDGSGLSFLQREPRKESGEEDEEAGEEDDDAGKDRKDRVMQWLPPFGEDDLRVLLESEEEIRSLHHSPDARWLFLTERKDGTETLYAVEEEDPGTRYTLYRWDTDEALEDPGRLLTRSGPGGVEVVQVSPDGSHVYLSGVQRFSDPEAEAPRPFLDRVEILTGEVERLFHSEGDAYEEVTAVLDDVADRLVLTRERADQVPDAFHLDRATGERTPLTSNRDPHPTLTAAHRDRITVTRPDGVRFKVDITMPAGWDGATPLPGILWFYPREYDDQEAYDESWQNFNPHRFPLAGARSLEILTAAGYAVIQPDHPIIGPSSQWNDNYMVDLRANLLTVIDAAAERGYLDRRRVALGGHSYGGFGTINAMVQTPYFRAGIAGAPNSNRLLTPLGFQREPRLLWEARERYLELSPFLWAERLSGALLIYHGEDDQNVGTFPDNSWRLIHALNGLGKTAALYMYPYEGHGPATRETLLDMWTRWVAWLDHYVKEADLETPVAPVVAEEDGAGMEGPGRR